MMHDLLVAAAVWLMLAAVTIVALNAAKRWWTNHTGRHAP